MKSGWGNDVTGDHAELFSSFINGYTNKTGFNIKNINYKLIHLYKISRAFWDIAIHIKCTKHLGTSFLSNSYFEKRIEVIGRWLSEF